MRTNDAFDEMGCIISRPEEFKGGSMETQAFYFVVRVDAENDDKAEEIMNELMSHNTSLEWVWQDYDHAD